MAGANCHTIETHFRVGLKSAAQDIIDDLGYITGYSAAADDRPKLHDCPRFKDIRAALAIAQHELDVYDAAVRAGRTSMTNEEWRAELAARTCLVSAA